MVSLYITLRGYPKYPRIFSDVLPAIDRLTILLSVALRLVDKSTSFGTQLTRIRDAVRDISTMGNEIAKAIIDRKCVFCSARNPYLKSHKRLNSGRLIVHNGLYDLMFTYECFVRPLPQAYDKFKADINRLNYCFFLNFSGLFL